MFCFVFWCCCFCFFCCFVFLWGGGGVFVFWGKFGGFFCLIFLWEVIYKLTIYRHKKDIYVLNNMIIMSIYV